MDKKHIHVKAFMVQTGFSTLEQAIVALVNYWESTFQLT